LNQTPRSEATASHIHAPPEDLILLDEASTLGVPVYCTPEVYEECVAWPFAKNKDSLESYRRQDLLTQLSLAAFAVKDETFVSFKHFFSRKSLKATKPQKAKYTAFAMMSPEGAPWLVIAHPDWALEDANVH
jgi:hypothetical protein